LACSFGGLVFVGIAISSLFYLLFFKIKKNFILKILTVVIAQSENWYLSVKMKGAPIKSEKRKEEINAEKIN